MDGPYRARVYAYLQLIDAFGFEIDTVSRQLRARLCQDRGYLTIRRIPGVGPVLAGVFVAEIGEAARFGDAAHLVSWAGLTPKHRESDTTVHRGPITKQGSGLVRWAAIGAAQKIPASAGWLVSSRARIAERRGRNIATVAVGQQRREPLHPPVDRDVVDLDATFGEQFLDVAVGQAVAQVSTHRHHDHLGREPETGERRPRRRPDPRPRSTLHRSTLP